MAASSPGASQPTKEEAKYLWHHRLHERVANETLAFFFMAIDPHYNREHTKRGVKQALARLGVLSYTLWEVIGEHDVVLQAWLPPRLDIPKLQEELAAGLIGRIAFRVDMLTMTVERFLCHGMWEDQPDLDEHVTRSVDSRHYTVLNGPARVPGAAISRYKAAGLIRTVPKYNTIKFFIRITNPQVPMNEYDHDQLVELAKDGIREAGVEDPVLMRVRGDGGMYLLSGRVAPKGFESIPFLTDHFLHQRGVLEHLRCRTTTHISALYGPVDRREQLLPEELDSPVTGGIGAEWLPSMLLRPEDDRLEFKSAAFTDVDQKVGRDLKRPPRTREQQVDVIAKAVCGILNAAGGYVVIGVAELAHYSIEELEAVYGPTPCVGGRAVIGVAAEYPDATGWDNYQRQLAAKLVRRMSPGAAAWLKYHPVAVEDHTVCVIEVRRPSKWFFMRENLSGTKIEVFYGRTGGETRPFWGQDMTDFQDAHPRTTRGERE
jgi:hypothetical protein